MQVGHQGDSETIGEHQVGGNCIHYHSVRHGTANECKDDVGHTQGGTYRHTQVMCICPCIKRKHENQRQNKTETPAA